MGRNLIVCCDGTSNQFGPNNTNVVRLYQLLDLPRGENSAPAGDAEQIGFYDPGVGTFDYSGQYRESELRRIWGQATGKGIRQNICEAYRFLMDWHMPGDRVFLFGFSRGAYTARALSGMLHQVGLLTEGNLGLIDYAYDMYKYQTDPALKAGFKATFCRECAVEMVGVWDTVATVIQARPSLREMRLLPATERFSNSAMSEGVTAGYQACALDENRTQFRLSLWDEHARQPHQTIEQVWFAGGHADVGGFWTDRGLTDITLDWMIRKAVAHGLVFETGWQDTLAMNPLAPQHDTRSMMWKISDIANLFRPDSRFPPDRPFDKYSADGRFRVHDSVRLRAEAPAVPHVAPGQAPKPLQYRQDLGGVATLDWIT